MKSSLILESIFFYTSATAFDNDDSIGAIVITGNQAGYEDPTRSTATCRNRAK
jgi:hypothetical protein